MCDVTNRILDKGKALGRAEGEANYRNKMNTLIIKMSESGEIDLITKVATDPEFEKEMMKKYNIEE